MLCSKSNILIWRP